MGYIIKFPIIFQITFFFLGIPYTLNLYNRSIFYRNIILLLSLALLIIGTIYFYHGLMDPSGLKMIIFGFLSAVGANFFISYYKKYYYNYSIDLLQHIFYIGIIHGFIIILSLNFLSDFMREFFVYSDKALETWEYRPSGLLYGGFGILSLSQSMIGIIGLVLLFFHTKIPNYKLSIYVLIFGIIIIFISLILTGRIGLISFILSLTIILFITDKKWKNLCLFLPPFIAVFYTMVWIGDADISGVSNILKWSLEVYYKYMDSGVISSGSTDILFDKMYFLPESGSDLFLGEGNFGDGLVDLETDVGYIKTIFGAGFFGLFFILLVFIYPIFWLIKNRKFFHIIGLSLFLELIILFISNAKDPTLFNIFGTNQIIFILISMLAYSNIKKHCNRVFQ